MIEIDGSGGGGQVLRTVIGLSALMQEPVKLFNIRTNKPMGKHGIRPQHLMGVKIVREFCDAVVHGLEEGSTDLQFTPKKLEVNSGKIDIGTAGSVTLLLQTLFPILIFTKKPVSLEITGGTEVKWSPTVQYYKSVTIPLINKLGAKFELEVIKHGYYPKGGGKIKIESKPARKLRPWNCQNRGEIKSIYVESVCGDLPKSIAKRQAESALRLLQYHFPKTKSSIIYKNTNTLSKGSSCTCYAVCENSVLGSSYLGERGLKAETVGREAAEELVKSIERGACLDKYMADQILPFLALADGKSTVLIEGATDHVVTNVKVIEKMLPVKFQVKGKAISVDGIGWK
ncbi:MAG: RNA 3'-terminal phosphate cyclase [Candidatus Aenigmarchaeota archaeon]|nr:RNA 3'-terminal phosphate cyclase [Candidatus Aenigmarchaeota archaeon]